MCLNIHSLVWLDVKKILPIPLFQGLSCKQRSPSQNRLTGAWCQTVKTFCRNGSHCFPKTPAWCLVGANVSKLVPDSCCPAWHNFARMAQCQWFAVCTFWDSIRTILRATVSRRCSLGNEKRSFYLSYFMHISV